MKDRHIQHLLLNSGESQLSPLNHQSVCDLKLLRMAIRGDALKVPLNLCGFELQLYQREGWAHVEFSRNDVTVLESFSTSNSNDTACWCACTERFRDLVSCRFVPHSPVLLLKLASIPWCASLLRRDFSSLSDGQIVTLAFLQRSVAWEVYFESLGYAQKRRTSTRSEKGA
jgi:hypothetical protein